MENTETQAGAEEPTAPQRPSEALSKEAALDLWEREKEEREIEGKLDLSHVTAGLCRCLKLSQERDRRKLKRAVQSWADQCGLTVCDKTIRNWVNGKWTEEAAAVAVLGARVAILESNMTLKTTALNRVYVSPLWLGGHPGNPDFDRKVARQAYKVAFELCVFGAMTRSEHSELLINALHKVCELSDKQLMALNDFLNAFIPDSGVYADSMVHGPLTASDKVQDLTEELWELDNWAIQVDEASGEGSCLS